MLKYFSDEDTYMDPDWIYSDEEDTTHYTQISTISMPAKDIVDEPKCIAFNISVIDLVRKAVGRRCDKCKSELNFRSIMRGTCLVVVWDCPKWSKCHKNGHSQGSWASQPRVHNMYAGNLLIPAATLLSGNSHTKVEFLASLIKLGFVTRSNFHR